MLSSLMFREPPPPSSEKVSAVIASNGNKEVKKREGWTRRWCHDREEASLTHSDEVTGKKKDVFLIPTFCFLHRFLFHLLSISIVLLIDEKHF